MYYGRKKAIIIAIVLVILAIVLAGGTFFVYTATDLFKSNQTLFFQYLGQAFDDLKYVENPQISEIEELTQTMPYTLEGTLSYSNESEEEEMLDSILEKLKIGLEANVDNTQEKAYAKMRLRKDMEDIFTLEYANSNQIYALKSDEIMTAFLGIENENLKVLAQKMGISDTSNFPDNIKQVKIAQLLEMAEEEKQHIRETYLTLFMQTIGKEKFSKEKNLAVSKDNIIYNTTAYRLSLSAEELKQVEIAMLQTLKEDSITLNLLATKAKLLGLDENYTQVNLLSNEIQKQINAIESKNDTIDEGITIMIYVDKGEVITTEIILKNQIKYTIYGEAKENISKRYVLIENLDANAEYSKIEIKEQDTRSTLESTYQIEVSINDDTKVTVDIINEGAASEENLKTTVEVAINKEDTNWAIHYNQEMNFQETVDNLIELNRNNCGILNDYTTEQLQVLLQAIEQRAGEVMTEKVILITGEPNAMEMLTNTDETTQAIEEYGQEVNRIEQQIENELNRV